MKRQFAVFLVASVVMAAWVLVYSSRVIADLTIFYPTSIDLPGTKITLNPRLLPATNQEAYLTDIQKTQRILGQRLDYLQLSNYYGVVKRNDQFEVTLPNSDNLPYIINVITRVGEVKFIDGGTSSPPVGQYLENRQQDNDGIGQYQTLFTGQEIITIAPPDSTTGDIFYRIELQPATAARLTTFVQTRPDAYACVVIDNEVINCSKMYHLSGNTLDILPNLSGGTGLSLADIAIFLKSGPLPVSLEVITD